MYGILMNDFCPISPIPIMKIKGVKAGAVKPSSERDHGTFRPADLGNPGKKIDNCSNEIPTLVRSFGCFP